MVGAGFEERRHSDLRAQPPRDSLRLIVFKSCWLMPWFSPDFVCEERKIAEQGTSEARSIRPPGASGVRQDLC